MTYGCDYGHDHRTHAAKVACEERNDNRGLPRAARFAKNVKASTLPQRHDCRVQETYLTGLMRYQAICDICGRVGQPQTRSHDANAIATRHFEQGGFERRGA